MLPCVLWHKHSPDDLLAMVSGVVLFRFVLCCFLFCFAASFCRVALFCLAPRRHCPSSSSHTVVRCEEQSRPVSRDICDVSVSLSASSLYPRRHTNCDSCSCWYDVCRYLVTAVPNYGDNTDPFLSNVDRTEGGFLLFRQTPFFSTDNVTKRIQYSLRIKVNYQPSTVCA